MANLSLLNVCKSFRDNQVISPLDLNVQDGEFCVLVGPSGCGKSTLLRIIAGLEKVTDGQVYIGDDDVTEREPADRSIAMVFQSYALYPHMTVERNIGFGLEISGVPKKEIRKRVRTTSDTLQITHLLNRKPRELSGGQRQRVAIGRAISRNPKLFLLDEPLSNLDAALRVGMRLELLKLKQKLQATMIYVTHDQTEAMTLADRIVILNQGRIEQQGTPLEIFHNPVNRFVASFIGIPAMNFLPVKITDVRDELVTFNFFGAEHRIQCESTSKVTESMSLGVRPEYLSLSPEESDFSFEGKLFAVEMLGSESYLYLYCEEREIIVKGGESIDVSVGQTVKVYGSLKRSHLFDQHGTRVSSRKDF
ncbi:Maltose/maltodextrin import ATP-binding protein malK [Vibrio nigripulchritudo SO65]|uniref:ABC transporter ATP-binding protein n=1 Tax=Vibrio nigripulchritudo TaxID=28173 RepID=UPI0003B1C490|nr:sn-glycerol-3-phosphate ABC transporter ATP-binding protein UgpC [Vibrio nigripulchritudo]CCN37240.1 Maltose/maltodextrin import ATP-binding protein malK [Vibrio nigripulchritudo AM115]CCN42373.1 Maltose/maltodextrin import ATP-binding protein malK [Vibrio nigripulchritudo FTn2]CCN67128.1 Maltose/maltodextrin import ATP-binding protein malK [Vibrio nigripulchritudo POn4]CCN79315.1 Maltose/maltodextrin import ATP-binding protein malK [Vibrio nigripulchritudo SO65]